MVVFNELRLSDDKKKLIIDCGIEGLNVYDGLYINTIYLEYYKNIQDSLTPSDKAILVYDHDEDGRDEQLLRICVSEDSLTSDFGTKKFEAGLFYVIVQCDGPSSALANLGTLSCGFDNTTDIGVVLDWKLLFDFGMQYIFKLGTSCEFDCSDTTGFDSFSILWNAIKLAVSTCDYDVLETLWDKFIRIAINNKVSVASGCRCK